MKTLKNIFKSKKVAKTSMKKEVISAEKMKTVVGGVDTNTTSTTTTTTTFNGHSMLGASD